MVLRNLDSFGEIAAEDDAVLDYFMSTSAVDEILQGNRLLVLGRKGSGKTALVKHFTESNRNEHGKPLSLRQYPWQSHQELMDAGAAPSEAYVSSWKLLIAIRLASMVCELGRLTYTDAIQALQTFLIANFGSIDPVPREILARDRMVVEGLTVAPSIAGFALGSISLGLKRGRSLGAELNVLTDAILNDTSTAIAELGLQRLFLHFDELDQGLDRIDQDRGHMLIGLILAAREISKSGELRANICPIVYLRTDIWEQLNFSDKNKITRSATVKLNWGPDQLKEMVDIRLNTKIGADFEAIDDGENMRGSQRKWNHILARTFLRPRDVIQFLNEALRLAKNRDEHVASFSNDDINRARDAYSEYLKQELDDEITPHWAEWDDGLEACADTTTITFKREDFIANYQARHSGMAPDAEAALEMLYRFSVIGYESRLGTGGTAWTYRYSEPNRRFDHTVNRLKLHSGLKEYTRVKEERSS